MVTNRNPQKPKWIRVKAPSGPEFNRTQKIVRESRLHTICEEALCPNRSECWRHGTATFLLLGDICTRGCTFCAVAKGKPSSPDVDEPQRVADAAEKMKLRHVVLTSVNRDDLPDGGAWHFADTVKAIKERIPDCSVEVLVPDFLGDWSALEIVMEADIAILNHNLETVPRLYPRLRPKADYARSLELLERGLRINPEVKTKAGIMIGVGEKKEEVLALMRDVRDVGGSVLTIGQYLQPSPRHHPVVRYVTLEEFEEYRQIGSELGYEHVESGPFVRSSYHAWKHA